PLQILRRLEVRERLPVFQTDVGDVAGDDLSRTLGIFDKGARLNGEGAATDGFDASLDNDGVAVACGILKAYVLKADGDEVRIADLFDGVKIAGLVDPQKHDAAMQVSVEVQVFADDEMSVDDFKIVIHFRF